MQAFHCFKTDNILHFRFSRKLSAKEKLCTKSMVRREFSCLFQFIIPQILWCTYLVVITVQGFCSHCTAKYWFIKMFISNSFQFWPNQWYIQYTIDILLSRPVQFTPNLLLHGCLFQRRASYSYLRPSSKSVLARPDKPFLSWFICWWSTSKMRSYEVWWIINVA